LNGIVALTLVQFLLAVPDDNGTQHIAINPMHVVSVQATKCPRTSKANGCVQIWTANDRIEVVASTYDDAVAKLNGAVAVPAQ